MRTFEDDLRKDLEDPEFAAYFANAQAESARELFEFGVVTELTETSGCRAIVIDWLMEG